MGTVSNFLNGCSIGAGARADWSGCLRFAPMLCAICGRFLMTRFFLVPIAIAWAMRTLSLNKEAPMPTQKQTLLLEIFDDLPLFHVPRHRQIWESLTLEARRETTHLLSQMFLEHVENQRLIREGDASHE